MNRERVKKERDIALGDLATIRRLQREIEVDAQIVGALALGNPFELLWTSPAGINPARNRGCVGLRHANLEQERAWAEGRFEELSARFAAGEEETELDALISSEKNAGRGQGSKLHDELSAVKDRTAKSKRRENGPEARKFAKARVHKDTREAVFRQTLRDLGVLYELTDAELVAEHEENVRSVVEEVNRDRVELGLKKVKLVEE
jgi:hypothetical protein